MYVNYVDALKRLCEDGLPKTKYFEACAKYVMEYNAIKKGVMPKKERK